jgi:predicted RNase H-like HicB family nuclease
MCRTRRRRTAPAPVFDSGDRPSTAALRLRAVRCETGRMEKYTVVVHQEPEGGFWAEVSALPGCNPRADTLSELMRNVREAISGLLEVMREQGRKPESNVQILDIAV